MSCLPKRWRRPVRLLGDARKQMPKEWQPAIIYNLRQFYAWEKIVGREFFQQIIVGVCGSELSGKNNAVLRHFVYNWNPKNKNMGGESLTKMLYICAELCLILFFSWKSERIIPVPTN